jgi:hypothetical protein
MTNLLRRPGTAIGGGASAESLDKSGDEDRHKRKDGVGRKCGWTSDAPYDGRCNAILPLEYGSV